MNILAALHRSGPTPQVDALAQPAPARSELDERAVFSQVVEDTPRLIGPYRARAFPLAFEHERVLVEQMHEYGREAATDVLVRLMPLIAERATLTRPATDAERATVKTMLTPAAMPDAKLAFTALAVSFVERMNRSDFADANYAALRARQPMLANHTIFEVLTEAKSKEEFELVAAILTSIVTVPRMASGK